MMPAPRCQACGKKCYTETSVIRAALNSSRTFGVAFRFYPCKSNASVFHVTSLKVS